MQPLEAAVREVLAASAVRCELSVEPTKHGHVVVASRDQHWVAFPLHTGDLANARLGRWIAQRVVEAFSGAVLHV